MSITVQEIVNLPILNTAKVQVGIEFLDKRNVEWVSAIEGPVENFVREHEFILTTGMGCENDPNLFFQFVKDVYHSGASALGIALGRFIFSIPEEILHFAKENDFIIIELPWEIRFADIQRETMKEINRWQQEVSEQAQSMQKTLINFVIHGKSLVDMIKYVEQEFGWIIVYSDNKGRVKTTRPESEEIIYLWRELENNEAVDMDESAFRHIRKIEYNDGYIIRKEITSGGRNLPQGYFIILMDDKSLFSNSALQVMENLSAATALWISREDAIVKTEIRLRNEFIWGLAKTPHSVMEKNIQSRARLFGYRLDIPYVCILGYSENFDSLAEDRYDSREFGVKNIIYYIEEEIHYAASVVKKRAAFTFDENHLVIFLESKEEEQSAIHHFIDLIEKRFNALMPGAIFSWGIGIHGDGIMQFHESYKKASSALDLGRKQKGLGKRVSFEDTQLNRLLLNLADNEEVRDITLTTIAPLIEYEEKREMDLIDTFIAYDNQNGNVSQAARILNLHRQSLLYRLRKIEGLTKLSLDNPDDVFLLSISIKVWQTGALIKVKSDTK